MPFIRRPAIACLPRIRLLSMVFAALCLVDSARAAELRPVADASPAVVAEVGGAPGAQPVSIWSGDLEQELEIGLNWLVPNDDDLESTYGGVPVVQLRLSVRPGERTRFFLGSGYGWSRGDPYYGQATFEGNADAELRIIPIQMGVRVNLAPREDLRLNLGVMAEADWIRESLPRSDFGGADLRQESSDWTGGVGLTFGPELRSRDLDWAVGFEGGVAVSAGTSRHAPATGVNPTGMSGRLYFTTRI